MGDLAKGKQRIGIVIDDGLVDLIRSRAEAIDLAPSRYAAMIVEKWRTDGASPITEPDRLMQLSKQPVPPLPPTAPAADSKKNPSPPAPVPLAPPPVASKSRKQLTIKKG
ncbi:hypothetical protein Ga0100230_005660 [Opitutaceae bacterium TAV3]|nr:hypothetical protein Ga0100230_005660 [Opitutaceae bacterium TAV3]